MLPRSRLVDVRGIPFTPKSRNKKTHQAESSGNKLVYFHCRGQMRCVINAKTHFSIRRRNTSVINVPNIRIFGKGLKEILQGVSRQYCKGSLIEHLGVYSLSVLILYEESLTQMRGEISFLCKEGSSIRFYRNTVHCLLQVYLQSVMKAYTLSRFFRAQKYRFL